MTQKDVRLTMLAKEVFIHRTISSNNASILYHVTDLCVLYVSLLVCLESN